MEGLISTVKGLLYVYFMWTVKELLCLFIVTAAIIDGRFNVDSQGIII